MRHCHPPANMGRNIYPSLSTLPLCCLFGSLFFCNWVAIFRLHLPWVLEPPERGWGGGRHQQPQAGQAAHLHSQPLLRYNSIRFPIFLLCFSVRSVCFWASWIRIRIRNSLVRIWIRPSWSKKLRTTLISTVLWLLYDFLSLKNHVNVPSKGMSIKLGEKKLFFVGILKVTDKTSRIRIR